MDFELKPEGYIKREYGNPDNDACRFRAPLYEKKFVFCIKISFKKSNIQFESN